jgi:hypothetical protein
LDSEHPRLSLDPLNACALGGRDGIIDNDNRSARTEKKPLFGHTHQDNRRSFARLDRLRGMSRLLRADSEAILSASGADVPVSLS